MTVFAAITVALLVASNWVWLRAFHKRQEAHDATVQKFVTRVLHPEVVPVEKPENGLPPDEELRTREMDEFDKVGTIDTAYPEN